MKPSLATIVLGVVIGNFATFIVAAVGGQMISALQSFEMLPEFILMLFVILILLEWR